MTNKTTIKQPLIEFTGGYMYEVGVRDKNGNPVHKEDWLYVLENGEAERDVFVIEKFFTAFVIFVEFENFDKARFDDDGSRASYNRTIIKAYNHFAAKYVLADGNGTLNELSVNGQSSTLSYSLSQAYFDKQSNLTDEEYLKRTVDIKFTRTSVVIERLAGNGMPGADEAHIQHVSVDLKQSVREAITNEDSFLASALVELNNQHYRYALLEGFIAVEAIVDRFLSIKKKQTNILKKNLDDFKAETGIGYQTNIEIPLVLGQVDEAHNILLEKLNKVRRTRNKIVHEGMSVDHLIALDAIQVCRAYVNLLQSKL